MAYTNSKLVNYKKISPNRNSPRNHKIGTISIHCVVGQCSAETLGNIFASPSKQASSNYGVDKDGRIGLYVEEKDRSWCTSSASNDNRAITIEVASDTYHPYKVTDKAYKALIKLLVDICKRNGIKKLLWKGDKSLIGQVSKQNMTVHRWFANKSCPGDYLYNLHGQIAKEVNAQLEKKTTATTTTTTTKKPTTTTTTKTTTKKATDPAKSFSKTLAGTYKVTADDGLNVRNGASTKKAVMVAIPKNTKVQCYGYYTTASGVKWLYVQFTYNKVTYTGFCSSTYLKKV